MTPRPSPESMPTLGEPKPTAELVDWILHYYGWQPKDLSQQEKWLYQLASDIKRIQSATMPEPVASLSVSYFRGCKSMENTEFQLSRDMPEGVHQLYSSEVLDLLAAEKGYASAWHQCVMTAGTIAGIDALDTPQTFLIQLRDKIDRAELAESRLAKVMEALRRLSFAAQTTGGTAGRDAELCDATDNAAAILSELTKDGNDNKR